MLLSGSEKEKIKLCDVAQHFKGNNWERPHGLFLDTASLTKTADISRPSPRLRYLLVAADATPDALQLCVADLPELVLGHGHHPLALGNELAAVADEEAVVTGERLQDLTWTEIVVINGACGCMLMVSSRSCFHQVKGNNCRSKKVTFRNSCCKWNRDKLQSRTYLKMYYLSRTEARRQLD